MSDPAISGYGVVRPPGLRPAPNNTVVANISGPGEYPVNVPIGDVIAAGGGISYQGTWNANTNTPTITSGVGTNGEFYVVSVAGTTDIDGIDNWSVGDWIIYASGVNAWQKLEGGISNAEINAALGHDLTLGGDLTTANAFTTSGNFALTLTATGATNVTLPTSGTLATVAATLQVANNLSDLNNAGTARTNLGLGTAATQATSAFLQPSNNLSDVASASTSRTNLGLGTAAVLNVGTGANNIVQLTAGGILPAVDGSLLTNLPAAGGGLLAVNNLSDVDNVADSRDNLGLGTAAVEDADIFLQVANDLSDLNDAATARTNLGLGTAATQATSAFLQPSNNLSDVANAGTARTNLGLGTAATQATSAFLQPSNNLSDVANAGTARTNLGLGTAATQNTSAFLQPSNNLSDVASVATTRVNLLIDKITTRGDATYTIQTTDTVIALTATLTTSRAWTLPAANAVNAGKAFTIIDLASGVSGANPIVITRAGSDTINGTTTVNFTVPYGAVTVISDGTSAWEATKIGLEQGGTGATTASDARTNLGLVAIASSGSASDLSTGTVPSGRMTGSYTGITAVGTLTSVTTSGAITQTSNSATAFVSGPNGATNPVFTLVNNTGSQAAGFRVTGATTGGNVQLDLTDSGSNTNLRIDAKGSGTITLGATSTGAITLTRATTLSAALTYGGVTLSNAVTGTGNMVLATSPSLTTPTLGVASATSVSADAFLVTTSSINAQTGTTYTLLSSDNGKLVTCSNASAITVTVPSGLTSGFWCEVEQLGAGQVTLSASSTTLHSAAGLKTRAQYSVVRIRYEGSSNTYNISGDSAT